MKAYRANYPDIEDKVIYKVVESMVGGPEYKKEYYSQISYLIYQFIKLETE
ncbi:MAG: hypothetical protein ACI9XP_001097 [Lentimonas sp.]